MNLLRPGGRCGIITPGSVYNDLGAKQLREMLFRTCQIDTLFGLQNERYIFEGVDHRQKVCILSFQKGGETESFVAAFRISISEALRPDQLEAFFHSPSEHLRLSVETIRCLSPDSLSIMEFKSEDDVRFASRLSAFPSLGANEPGTWSVRFHREFDMTNDSDLFKTSDGRDCLPLYEGKMIHQFNHQFALPKYWLDEREARERLLGKKKEESQQLDYQSYRLGFRDVARNTDERTCIMTMLPPRVFCPHTLPTAQVFATNSDRPNHALELYLCACANSFVVDYILRQRVTNHLTFFLLNQVPLPRVSTSDAKFKAIVERAARLICTTTAFDDLAKEVGIKSHKQGISEPAKRAALRSELDGLVAHLYGLTETEFTRVLSTFSLVTEPVKVAAQNAYRDVERGLDPMTERFSLNKIAIQELQSSAHRAVRSISRRSPCSSATMVRGRVASSRGWKHIATSSSRGSTTHSSAGSDSITRGTRLFYTVADPRGTGEMRMTTRSPSTSKVAGDGAPSTPCLKWPAKLKATKLDIEKEFLKLPLGRLYRRDYTGQAESFNDDTLERVRKVALTESACPQDWSNLCRGWQFLRLNPDAMGLPSRTRSKGVVPSA